MLVNFLTTTFFSVLYCMTVSWHYSETGVRKDLSAFVGIWGFRQTEPFLSILGLADKFDFCRHLDSRFLSLLSAPINAHMSAVRFFRNASARFLSFLSAFYDADKPLLVGKSLAIVNIWLFQTTKVFSCSQKTYQNLTIQMNTKSKNIVVFSLYNVFL